MRESSLPKIGKILPPSEWNRFAQTFGKVTGLRLSLAAAPGGIVAGSLEELGLPGAEAPEDPAQWPPFLRKIVKQAHAGDETVLFRDPSGRLVFAGPVTKAPRLPTLTLLGSPADEGETEPRRLQGWGTLARLCLAALVRGHAERIEAERDRVRAVTLFDLLPDLVQAGSVLEVWGLALSTLGVLFEVENAAVLVRDPGAERLRVQTATGPLEKALLTWSAPVEGPGGSEWLGRRPVRIDDPHELTRLGLPEAVERLALFPVGTGDQPTVALAVVNRELDGEEWSLLRGFGVQLGIVLENRRLREDAQRRHEQVAAVRSLSQRFLGSLDPGELFRVILDEARKLTGARKGSLMVPEEDDGALRVRAAVGMAEKVAGRLKVRPGEGIAGRVFATGEPIIVHDIELDPRFRRKNRPRFDTRSFLSLPIRRNGSTVGVLNLADKATGEPFSPQDLDVLETVMAQATLAIERSAYWAQSRELRRISITDGLTGLLNRRYFQERLAQELDRASRHNHPLALIMIDIDHFKPYNDSNGHPAGDKALVLLGRILRAGVRAIDVVSRFGGEEFAIILPETRKAEALEIGERIRREVEAFYFPGEERQPLGRLTVSMGVAAFPEDARDLRGLIQRADRALYLAKARGRNRIEAYAPPPPQPQPDAAEPAAENGGWTRVL